MIHILEDEVVIRFQLTTLREDDNDGCTAKKECNDDSSIVKPQSDAKIPMKIMFVCVYEDRGHETFESLDKVEVVNNWRC